MPTLRGIILSKKQCPLTPEKEEDMIRVPYASVVGSLMYAMLCIVVPDTNDEDPTSYEEAMTDFDKEIWHEAMNHEIKSMFSNSI